jgi:hypothetical protein
MYVADALRKPPYVTLRGDLAFQPPYEGVQLAPAQPTHEGHFDHIHVSDRKFRAVTTYASVRFVLELWEQYLGRRVHWHFSRDYPRLEIIPLVAGEDTFAGYGYLEFGGSRKDPLCQNLGTVAHAVGQLIHRAVIGEPGPRRTIDYRAHEKACADLVALVAVLEFDSVVDSLLEETRGDLLTPGLASRLGPLRQAHALSVAVNGMTMTQVMRRRKGESPPDRGMRQSRLLTGVTFDILVGSYQQGLVERRVIPEELAERSRPTRGPVPTSLGRKYARYFRGERSAFKAALVQARRQLGELLAKTWDRARIADLSCERVLQNMIAADRELTGGRQRDVIEHCFRRRGIETAR